MEEALQIMKGIKRVQREVESLLRLGQKDDEILHRAYHRVSYFGRIA